MLPPFLHGAACVMSYFFSKKAMTLPDKKHPQASQAMASEWK
jgi:hypothetical protein